MQLHQLASNCLILVVEQNGERIEAIRERIRLRYGGVDDSHTTRNNTNEKDKEVSYKRIDVFRYKIIYFSLHC